MDEHLPPAALAAADDLVADFQRSAGAPGVAYGIVAGGALVHTAGYGQRWLGGPPPDAGTVFRIASMTKSFTAAAALALRDDGLLWLADPVLRFVPELSGMRQVSADAPDITVQHLLTMTAGFPTDDPWGDRQQGLPLAEFAALLRRGVRQAWAPGTCFEYSNLGYALLGRVIAAAAGTSYQDYVASRLLGPLGLDRTGYDSADFDPEELARGYQRGLGPADWAELLPDGNGAFAPMGGVFSCVRDLARWVTGLAGGFPAGAEADGGPHPLRRATRREMQLPQVAIPPYPALPLPGGAGLGSQLSYGFGLFIEEHPAWGRLVFHGGGYPGFGSHMRWHPASGRAVIVLANSTYAGAHTLAGQLLDVLLAAAPAPPAGQPRSRGPVPAPGTPWPETLQAQRTVTELLRSWDDAAAARLFTPNVAQDEPYPARQEKAALTWERLGPPRDTGSRPAESDSPAHLRWWLHGERGDAAVEIKLTPEDPPRVQLLSLAVPPAWDSPLWRCTEALISLLNAGAPGWPADLPVAERLDTALLGRRLRTAGAWAGQCRAGALRAGNGLNSVTVELDGEHARLSLAVELDQAQRLRRVDIALLS
ncbi:MAG TPA: serine hydrolase domain-containing protein [Streptosporangiaceae bacterium]|nr:serine hydrolase domain-containing protein [Streptosporangiaceae bacterium]